MLSLYVKDLTVLSYLIYSYFQVNIIGNNQFEVLTNNVYWRHVTDLQMYVLINH